MSVAAAALAAPPRAHALPLAVALLLPITAVNALGFALPVVGLLRMSFNEATGTGAIRETVTLATWLRVATDSFYLELLVNSVALGLIVTALTLVVSYPIALYAHRSRGTTRALLVVLVISPLLTSAVVRTYGWMAILDDRGLINSLLAWTLGIGQYRLIYNETGVVIGLTEILMPYMILSLMAGFGRLDVRLEEAARSMGAPPWVAFRRVVLPLTLPGIALGSLLCFVIAVSAFITPKLLGGGRVFFLATEIYDQAIVTLNWPTAATLSMVVLAVFGTALAAYARVNRALD
jgi:putative spermidine/putrescine transport system permease protein